VRAAPVLRQVEVTRVLYEDRRLSYFGGCDYLRLSWHPALRAALAAGAAEYGASVGASRLTTGNAPLYEELEEVLARFFGAATVSLTSSGYLASLAAAQALAADHDQVLLDERAHACLEDAAVLTGLPIGRFAHRSPADLRVKLRRRGRRVRTLVMTDGLFSHQGDVAPLAEYLSFLPDSATLLVDDAHGVGVLGRLGRGASEGVSSRRLVITATLSKAFGAYGGVVIGSRRLQQALVARSRILAGNTPVPPPCARAALAAVEILEQEGAERRERLVERVQELRSALRAAGGPVSDAPGPMFSLAPKDKSAMLRLRRRLLAADIYPSYIRYPGGPAARYFRFALSSEHQPAQLQSLREVLTGFYQEP
jgi:7-keto-8-aminopelargonate synthetase-like enzyme